MTHNSNLIGKIPKHGRCDKYLVSFIFLLFSVFVCGQDIPRALIIQPLNGTVFESEQVKVDYFVSESEPKSARILVDDKPAQLLTEVKLGQNTVMVEVPKRDCKISIIVQNESGASLPAVVNLTWSERIFKPRLYILAIGVSKYNNAELHLQFAAKDAIDFSQSMLRQEGLLYEKVELALLTDERANAENVRNGLNWLQTETTFRDVAILYIAGHGIINNVGDFFFMPVNADINRINASCVDYSEIKRTIDAIAGKIVVFVDACHSGNVLGNNQRRAVLLTEAIKELTGADNGAVIFTSSTGRQFSLENSEWGNGAFTKALVEGLNGSADLFERKTITVKNLDSYVANRVKELTNGQQAPTTIIPNSVPDFPLAVVADNVVSPRIDRLNTRLPLGTRQPVAVFPPNGNVNDEIKGAVKDALQEGIANSSFYTLVKNDADYQKALREFEYQQQNTIDDNHLKEFGRAVSADYVCYANIRTVASNYRISYSLIDVKSAEISNFRSRSTEQGELDLLKVINEISEDLIGEKGQHQQRNADIEELRNANAALERENMARNQWDQLRNSTDIKALETFVTQFEGTSLTDAATARLNDEKLWESARTANEIAPYEQYLEAGISPQYLAEAKVLLEDAYCAAMLREAGSGNINELDSLHIKYTNVLPEGSRIREMNQLRCNTYYNRAVALSESKEVEDLKKSNEYFGVVKQECRIRTGVDIDSYVSKNDRKITKKTTLTRGFWGWTGDTRSIAGMTFGKLTDRKIGWYYSVRMSPKFVYPFLFETTYLMDGNGKVTQKDGREVKNFTLDESSPIMININTSLGITRKIYQPFWFYLGGGVSWDNKIQLSKDSKEHVKYTDMETIKPMLDFGLSLKLGGVVFSGGIRATSTDDKFATFGFQFAF